MAKVFKFGGTSLKDKESRKKVIDIIEENLKEPLIIVVSAMGRYPDPYATKTLQLLVSKKLTGRDYDRLVSSGEIISSIVLLDELKQRGILAMSLTSKEAKLQVKDKKFTNLDVDLLKTYMKEYQVIIVPGFQGINEKEEIEVLESGDSDYTAVYIAKKLGLDKVYLYSDVCGIYSGDPNYIHSAKLIPHVSYLQAMDLASHKARIICFKALKEAFEQYGFKIYLRSTFLDGCGTIIDHNETNIRTMSIDFDYVLVQFDQEVLSEDKSYIFEWFGSRAMIKKELLSQLKTDYTLIDYYTKVHFVGCQLDHDKIYLDFLNEFALCSSKETSSYYICKTNEKKDITLLHDIIVRED